MSQYLFPPEGGLKFVHGPSGRIVGVFVIDGDGYNTVMFVGELTTRGELANGYQTVAIPKVTVFAEIQRRGGDINSYLADLYYDINFTTRRILTSAPPFGPMPAQASALLPVTGANVVPELNKAMWKNFELVAGPDGLPLYRRKSP